MVIGFLNIASCKQCLGVIASLLLSFSPLAFADNAGLQSQAVLTTPVPWTANEIAVIVNDEDKLSTQIAGYYQSKRQIPAKQMIHVRFKPGLPSLSLEQFNAIKKQVDENTPAHVQGFLLTWLMPYRVECMSITTAFAAGFDKAFCSQECKETRHNPYFNSISSRPYDDFGWRPTMVLASKNMVGAKHLVDRGLASDYTWPKGSAYLLKTTDVARSSRAVFFPEVEKKFADIYPTTYLEKNFIENQRDIMFYFTGLMHVQKIGKNSYLPGAVADHLTSTGGVLVGGSQMSILEWIDAGVTGSYGTVVEPCNFPDKFTNPGVLMNHYLRGNSLIESYWKSVAEPGQGIFVGEPLAKPFARPH